MRKVSIKKEWGKYVVKKSRLGIFFDFFFLFVLIAMLVPSSRFVIATQVGRLFMFQPAQLDEGIILKEEDYQWRYASLEGKTDLFSRHKGRVVFLNFWATWCPPCNAELPAIFNLYKDYGDKVDFLLISNETPDVLQVFREKKGLDLPILNTVDELPSIFQSKSVPTTFVISAEGEVVLRKSGSAKWDGGKVRALLDSLL